jgi:hypothetical protein
VLIPVRVVIPCTRSGAVFTVSSSVFVALMHNPLTAVYLL